jgi:hypothetical protein
MAEPPVSPLAALQTAFASLLPVVDPARGEAVLRRAIVGLLADDGSAGRPLDGRSPPISTGDAETWRTDLRPRIRTQLDLAGMSLGDLANATGLNRSTLEKCLSPNGVTPGALLAGKLEAWLAGQSAAPEPEPAPITETGNTPPAGPNMGGAVARRDAGNGRGPAPLPPGTNGHQRPAPTACNGAVPGARGGRLDPEQRARLQALAERRGDNSLLTALGLSSEVLSAALIGRDIAPAAVEKVTAYLAGNSTTG